MKKTIFLFLPAMFFSLLMQGQRLLQKAPNSVKQEYKIFDKTQIKWLKGDEFVPPHSPAKKKSVTGAWGAIQIGETNYDLQTNGSVARRIINHGNGTLTAVWTIGTNASATPVASPDRGTGYNYFDGTNWMSVVTQRIEQVRTGWPSIGVLGNGSEYVISHDAAKYEFLQGTNTAIGSASWLFAYSKGGYNSEITKEGTIWGRIAIGGADKNTIHLISNYSDSSAGHNYFFKLNGVRSPMIYSRALKGGAEWDIKGVMLPGYDSSRSEMGGPDGYAIDAADSNVAIVLGGLAEDVTLWKSINNGTSFEKIFVDSFPYAPDYRKTAPLKDTIATNDGSLTILLDKQGKVHVAFARSYVWRQSKDTSLFAPETVELVYWNEITKQQISVPIPMNDIDTNKNGKYDVGDNTLNPNNKGARYGNKSLLCMPSMAMDTTGNIYIIFSLPADGDSTSDGQNYRDIWVVASQDSGKTWGKVQNLTKTTAMEEAFASVAKSADDYLHIVYQEDEYPGTLLTNNDDESYNYIQYLRVKTADVLSGTAGIAVNEYKQSNALFSVAEHYPNPFSGQTTLKLIVQKPVAIAISITNALGQKILNFPAESLNKGTHEVQIDASSLAPGFYLYTVKGSDYSVTGKMLVQ